MKKLSFFLALIIMSFGSAVWAADDIICPTNNQKPTEILIYFHGLLSGSHNRAESLDSFKQQLSQIRKTRPGVIGVHVNGSDNGWGGSSVSISDIVKKAQTACQDSGNWPITLAGHSAGGQAVRDRLGSAGRAIFLDAVYWNSSTLNDDCAKISLIDGQSTYQYSDSLVKKCSNQSGFHYIANKNSSLAHWAVRSKLSDFYLQTASSNNNDNTGNDVVTPGSSDPTPSVNTSLPKIDNPFDKLQVQIPGMERFSEPITKGEGEGMTIYNNWIAEYVIGVYNFGIGIIGVLAVVGLAIGGALWILAFGNPTLVAQGKSWITSSILGLLLALGSYMILNSINSDFVNLQSINTKKIVRIEAPGLPAGDDNEDAVGEGTTEGGIFESVGGQCFPLSKVSFSHSTWGFGDRRSRKKVPGGRCHAGVDIYNYGATGGPSDVVAIADGTVVNIYGFTNCARCNTNAIFINHGGYVINYGEINVGATYVKKGQTIKAGTVIGKANCCLSGGKTMLHLELYTPGVKSNLHWYPPAGQTVGTEKNYCRKNYLSSKPTQILDPTNTLKSLMGKMCGD